MLNIHEKIIEKLNYFNEIKKIPNIIFHGQPGCGKKTIVNNFINAIYDGDKEKIKSLVMYVNAGFGKGIKFIREELKFFAKTNINSNNGNIFKIIVLLNADKLTVDAQSALRRCIELFSHNTRFFLIVEDKYKILKPILSRFCDIYIPEPQCGNLYAYNNSVNFPIKQHKTKRLDYMKNEMIKIQQNGLNIQDLDAISTKLYEKGYSALDIIFLLEKDNKILKTDKASEKTRVELVFLFSKMCKEIRNEKILISIFINFMYGCENNEEFVELKNKILTT